MRDQQMTGHNHIKQMIRAELKYYRFIIGFVAVLAVAFYFLQIKSLKQQMVRNLQIISRLEQAYSSNLTALQYKFDQKLKASHEYSERIKLQLAHEKENAQKSEKKITELNEYAKSIDLRMNKTNKYLQQLPHSFMSHQQYFLKQESIRVNSINQSLTQLNGTFSKEVEKINKVIQYILLEENLKYNLILMMSKHSNWKIKGEIQSTFKDHYTKLSEHPMKMAKHSQGYSRIYNELLFSSNEQSFVQVKIQKAKDNQIGIGISTDEPIQYYSFWVKGKQIYNGVQLINVKSEFTIKENDTIAMLFDPHSKEIVFYVNKRYVGHANLPLNYNGNVQPFIGMWDKGDIISIL